MYVMGRNITESFLWYVELWVSFKMKTFQFYYDTSVTIGSQFVDLYVN